MVGAGALAAGYTSATAAVTTTQIQSVTTAAVPTSPTETREQRLARLVNADRTARGLKAYVVSPTLSAIAEQQAQRMANQRRLFHNPNLTTDVKNWQAVGENVAYTSTVPRAHSLLMNSPPHRANLLNTTFTQIGVGVVKDSGGTVWVVEVFRKPF